MDVLDVEWDVLLRFPVDRIGELRIGHHRQGDLLDDDGVAGQGGDDILRFEALCVENATDGVGNGDSVDDRAIDDRVGRNRFRGVGRDLETLRSIRFQLNGLHRARSNVETDDGLRGAEEAHFESQGLDVRS